MAKKLRECYYCGFPSRRIHKPCGQCPTCCTCNQPSKGYRV